MKERAHESAMFTIRGLTRVAGGLTVVGVGIHQYDTHFCYARFNRNMRSFFAAAATVIDYKIR